MKKKVLPFILVAAAVGCILFAACSGAAVRDDVAVDDIADQVDGVIDSSSMIAMEDSYITGAMKMDTGKFVDYIVKINSVGANIDEYGIFKAADKDSLKEAQKAVEDYLQLRRDTWMEEYMPEEKPKLESAVVKVMGNYIMYAILDEESDISAYAAFENALKSK